MDIALRHKLSLMLETLKKLQPDYRTTLNLRWQMNTDTVVTFLKEAEFISDTKTFRLVDGVLPSNGMECLGIPIEIILKDEINLVIKVV